MKVNHPSFGTGTILDQNEKTVTVDFNGNVKTLVAAFCKLTKEDGSALIEEVKVEKKAKMSNSAKRLRNERLLAAMTPDQLAKRDRSHAAFMKSMNDAELAENFLHCQIESNSYNKNLIR